MAPWQLALLATRSLHRVASAYVRFTDCGSRPLETWEACPIGQGWPGQQKVQSGGTPSLAPIGYLNVRKIVEGREVRTVEPDPERQLDPLGIEGVRQRRLQLKPARHRGRDTRPDPAANRQTTSPPADGQELGEVLRNPYYIGTVTWRGLQFEGKHLQLVTPETFARVQTVLDSHRVSGERSYRHKPYFRPDTA